MVEFQGDACFNLNDLNTFISDNKLNEVTLSKNDIWGPCNYSTPGPDIEATLDIQYQIGANTNTRQFYVTVQDWLYQYASLMYNKTDIPNGK